MSTETLSAEERDAIQRSTNWLLSKLLRLYDAALARAEAAELAKRTEEAATNLAEQRRMAAESRAEEAERSGDSVHEMNLHLAGKLQATEPRLAAAVELLRRAESTLDEHYPMTAELVRAFLSTAPAQAPEPASLPWRVGTKVPRNLYEGARDVGRMDTPELAARVVEAMNAAQAAEFRAGLQAAELEAELHSTQSQEHVRTQQLRKCRAELEDARHAVKCRTIDLASARAELATARERIESLQRSWSGLVKVCDEAIGARNTAETALRELRERVGKELEMGIAARYWPTITRAMELLR